jgi:hypothetical protein
MMDDTPETSTAAEKFDESAFPGDILFHERRGGPDRRDRFGRGSDTQGHPPRIAKERRARKERRRRIDPTTFEKQYTEDELEFMNAMQRFKVQTCKSFPTHGDVLKVALALGYRKVIQATDDEPDSGEISPDADDRGLVVPIDLGVALSDGPAD